jgi:hypothetical protein
MSVVSVPLFFALFMFLPAGTWGWPRGWLLITVLVGTMTIVFFILWRVNPDAVIARSHPHDLEIEAFITPALAADGIESMGVLLLVAYLTNK